MKNRTLVFAHLALFMVQLLYGANYTIAKGIMPDYITPIGIIFLRASFGAVVFWMLHTVFLRKAKEVTRKDIPLLIACSLVGIAINQISFYYGLNLTKPINASIIMLIVPIITFVGGVIFLKEKFTNVNILGIVIGCIGAFVLISYGEKINIGQTMEGDLFILLNATVFSIYLIIVRPLVRKYHPIVILKWVFTFGFIFTLPFTYPEIIKTDWHSIPPIIWGSIAYVLIGSTFFTYLLNGFALQKLTSRVVGAYIYLQPILATIIALLAREDTLTNVKIISGLMIFVGVFLASQKKAMVGTS